MVGVILAFLQQMTGINAIIYYANQIFAAGRLHHRRTQQAWPPCGPSARSTCSPPSSRWPTSTASVATAAVRRPVGMSISLVVVGRHVPGWTASRPAARPRARRTGEPASSPSSPWSCSSPRSPSPSARSSGPSSTRSSRPTSAARPSPWPPPSTGAPPSSSASSSSPWSTPSAPPATFWLFAVAGALAYVWVWRKVPETKGKTLEEITAIWDHDDVVAHTTADQPLSGPDPRRRLRATRR